MGLFNLVFLSFLYLYSNSFYSLSVTCNTFPKLDQGSV
jgi:hypothetical protein